MTHPQARVSEASTASDATPYLAVQGIAKRFGETRALISCSFDVRSGETHVLVGENGSGKSTLVKILSGVLAPDLGTLSITGTSRHLASPRRAQLAGIATVFQEILTVENLSVLDNIWLGTDGIRRDRDASANRHELAEAVIDSLTSRFPPVRTPVSQLNLGQRQVVVIARALVRNPQLLILDESTSALDISDRDRLFAEVERRRAAGASVIFISHRMDEIMEIAQRVTVLRAGNSVATLTRDESDVPTLIKLMSGREPSSADRSSRASGPAQSVVLRGAGLVLRDSAAPIDFELRSGEIVGLAGLEGHGQDEFVRALALVRKPLAGQLTAVETGAVLRTRGDATRAGVQYVPRDRRLDGIFEPLSILENFSLPTMGADTRIGLISRKRVRASFARLRNQLRIVLGNDLDLITTLSGGNQQKVLIARVLASRPRVLVLNDPTRGVDIEAKHDIYALLRTLAEQGVGVVLLSTELEEHLLLSDRVLVFRDGTLGSEFEREDLRRERLVAAMFGEEDGSPSRLHTEEAPCP